MKVTYMKVAAILLFISLLSTTGFAHFDGHNHDPLRKWTFVDSHEVLYASLLGFQLFIFFLIRPLRLFESMFKAI